MPQPEPASPEGIDRPTVIGSDSVDRSTQLYVPRAPGSPCPLPEVDFGDYELLHEVARGGMGVVYKAKQKGLDRIVALKMVLPGRLASAEDLERFRIEAEATARLQHPNIVAVHEIGQLDGQLFYSMDYIDGPSLAKRLAHGPVASPLAARYVLTIARAMQHAHEHGVLHRDLKPSNILLDAHDDPHITDFGLAKKIDADSGRTRTGAVLGTPSYMAPEQAAGKTREIGPACDVYGIGAILYELLTGRPPFRSETPIDTMLQVLEREPVPPRLLNPKAERDLETICLKCLEKDARRRYPSAAALAADLDRFLRGESISVRSVNVIARLARTLERSHLAAEFRTWGTMLLWFGLVVLIGHGINFWLLETHRPRAWLWASRLGQIALIGLTFWRFRGSRSLAPQSLAERQLWSIWIGYLVAYLIGAVISRELLSPGRQIDELTLYPFGAVLTGLAFFAMGGTYWGRCFAVGLAFFALAALMPLRLDWAPLEFGLMWWGTLTIIGVHLRRLGREAGDDVPLS
jgi:serine/threonine protein kinase